jgi:uncharacterized protein YqcC (DUF446 family)
MNPSIESNKSQRLLALFSDLTAQLKQLDEWQQSAPEAKRLASTQPFAVDTLRPTEWLQWVFLPKMTQLIDLQRPLPSGFEISPYFEQVWQGQLEFQQVLLTLSQIDKECV